jgi:hypothetical protein
MSTDLIGLFDQAQQEYRETFDADINLLDLLVHQDGETGVFLAPDGDIYSFAYVRDSGEVIAVEDEEASDFFEDFAYGMLESYEVDPTTFHGDAAGFYLGLAESRADKIGGKCGRGWQAGPGGKCVRGKGGGKLKQGGLGRKAAIAGAAGLGAAALGGAALLGGTKAGRAAVGNAANLAKEGGKALVGRGVVRGAPVKENVRVAGGMAKEAVKEVGRGIAGGAKEVAGNIKQGVGTAQQKAGELASQAKQKGLEAAGRAKIAGSEIKQKGSKLVDKAKAAGQEAGSNIKKTVKGAKDKATTALASAATGVRVKSQK